MSVIRTLDPVPEECFASVGPMFALFDALLAKYGKLYFISERVGSVLRRGLGFFPARALEPVLEVILGRMVASFAETGYASFIWIVGKLAAKFGDASRGSSGDNVGRILGGAFERIAEDLKKLVAVKPAESMPDGKCSPCCNLCGSRTDTDMQ